MSKIKLPHASGNSMSIGAPATNPSGDLELKLPATVGTAGQVLKNSDTAGTLEFGPPPRPYRNLIINGAMNVAQRATSSTSTGYKTVDRFLNSINGGTVTQAQHALTSSDTGPWAKGFRNSYHQTNTSASSDAAANFRNIYYYVEAQDLANSGWDYTSSSSYITLSFWAKSSLAGTYYIQLRSQDGTGQNYASSYTLVADTWKKITVKIPGNSNIQVDNNNGAGLQIYWVLDYGTNFTGSMSTDTWAAYSSSTRTPDFAQDWTGTASATFEITGVQLEVGDVATSFEHRSYGDEFQRCRRYYVKYGRWMGGTRASTNSRSWTLDFGMRLTGSDVSNGTYTNDGTSSGDVVYTGSNATRNVSNVSANTLGASSNSTGNQLSVGLEVGHSIGSGDNGIVTGLYLNGFTIDHEL